MKLYISREKFQVPYVITLDFLGKVILSYTRVIPMEEDIKPMEKYFVKYGLKPSDTIHLATIEKVGVTHIVTEDEDYDKVKEVRRFWFQ